MTTTIKAQLQATAEEMGDDPETLECFYLPLRQGQRTWEAEVRQRPMVRCGFADLPEREFYAGYGAVQGEPTIAFSDRYVYIRSVYDGAEAFEAVPRHPEHVTFIPEVGGG
jgi:hypothetical protein